MIMSDQEQKNPKLYFKNIYLHDERQETFDHQSRRFLANQNDENNFIRKNFQCAHLAMMLLI